jgi:multidrug efflux pump subunit AcrB
MSIKFSTRLLFLTIIAGFIWVFPGIATAAPDKLDTNYTLIIAQTMPEISLTPQQSQQLQAVNQGRSKQIKAVLDSSQRQELSHKLRAGDNLNQALDKLKMQPEQREMVKAIGEVYNLKLKALESKFSGQLGLR